MSSVGVCVASVNESSTIMNLHACRNQLHDVHVAVV